MSGRDIQTAVVPTTLATNQEQVEFEMSPNAIVASPEVGIAEAMHLGITFHDICYEVSQWKCCIRKPNKQILKNLTGLMTPGLNAIMGPTGSGKTTLLDIIAGRRNKSGLTGRVLINGEKQPENFKCMSGYVVQENILMGTLSVRENLYFSAALRLPSKMDWKSKKALVGKIIHELGLSKCADSKVGTEFIRGVSGGEGKRTNIGMELITEPRVLFLDEPTTGLDAFTAISVVQLLKNLSQRQNRVVIMSIHQPRYSIFKLCDRLTLLSQGEMVFHGSAHKSLEYFDQLGYPVEEHDNPADHFLDVINTCEQAMEERRKEEAVQASNPTIATYDSQEKKVINLGEFYRKSEEHQMIKSQLDPLLGNFPAKEGFLSPGRPKITHATSWIWQLWIVWLRTITNLVRNPMTSVIQIFIDTLFGLIVGLIYFQLDLTTRGFTDRLGAIFFVSSNQVFGSFPAVQTFIQGRALLIHENAGGYYSLSAFFLAKVLGNLIPNKIIPLIGFTLFSYFLMGFQTEPDRFFIFLLTIWLTSLASSAYGFMIGAAIRVATAAELLITTSYVVFMLFGGFLIALESLPVWFRWVQYLSIMRWSVEALAINEIDGLMFNDTAFDQGLEASTGSDSCSFSGQDQLAFLGFNTSWLWYDELALFGYTIVFLVLAYVFLAFNIRRRA